MTNPSTNPQDGAPAPGTPAPKSFGVTVATGIEKIAPEEPPIGIFDLLGVKAEMESEHKLAPHEVAVVRWLRKELDRVSNPFEAHNVGVLTVGWDGSVGVVDHQFDHIGSAGITSVMDGRELASGVYDPAGMSQGEHYTRSWSISVNMIADQTRSQGIERDTVTMPVRGSLGEWMDDYERTRMGFGALKDAATMLIAFPGHPVKVVSAWCAEVAMVSTVAEAEAFFAQHGECTELHMEVMDLSEGFVDTETHDLIKAATEKFGGKPAEALKAALRKVLESEASK